MSVFAEEEKKKEKQAKPAVQPKETVQRALSDVNGPEGGMLPESVSAKIQSKRGTGQRLSERNLQQYSQKFGRDMSDVHVHTDAESDSISRSLNARAFTIGSDVFLTKGIDPDGSGRDAQTMAHELTHVVQQGGHASSGRLKLGAADTAQEHEAESTAHRQYSPEMEEEEGTVQRGFLKDLGKSVGSTIGHNFLSMVGMEDAYNSTFGAKHKVQRAVDQLNEQEQETFNENELSIKTLKQDIGRFESELSGFDKNDQGRDSMIDDYNSAHDELEKLEKANLEMVKSVDESISKSDLEQFRADDTANAKGMFGGLLASSVMSGFSKGADKKKAGQAAMTSAAHSFSKDRSFSGRRAVYKKTAAGQAADKEKAKRKEAADAQAKAEAKLKAKAALKKDNTGGGQAGGGNADLVNLLQQLLAAFSQIQKPAAATEQTAPGPDTGVTATGPDQEEEKKTAKP